MKKIVSMITCFVLCAVLTVPVSAAETSSAAQNKMANDEISTYASNYFSGSTGRMNSLNGVQSTKFNVSSGSINSNAKVSGITVNVTVSSGSSGFYLILEDPYGNVAENYVSRSGEIKITDFNGLYPKGTWKVSILTVGTVSTATARLKVNYTY